MSKRITLMIEDMQCPNCSMILERIEDKLDGVLMAEASYRKGQLVVEFDETRLSQEQISAEVQRLGYKVGEIR
jgi:copper chaperone CopZ